MRNGPLPLTHHHAPSGKEFRSCRVSYAVEHNKRLESIYEQILTTSLERGSVLRQERVGCVATSTRDQSTELEPFSVLSLRRVNGIAIVPALAVGEGGTSLPNHDVWS